MILAFFQSSIMENAICELSVSQFSFGFYRVNCHRAKLPFKFYRENLFIFSVTFVSFLKIYNSIVPYVNFDHLIIEHVMKKKT
jgi:hypothetical protein